MISEVRAYVAAMTDKARQKATRALRVSLTINYICLSKTI